MPIAGPPLEHPVDIRDLLAPALAAKPDEAALVSRRARWTYRELDGAAERLARNLLELGLKPGERVASLMPNRCELVIHYLACLRAGLVATPLNYRYMPPEIDHALEVSGASALLAHDERTTDLAASTLAPRLPRGIISFNDDGGSKSPTFAELTQRSSTRDLERPDANDPALIFFTSGSTGKPKGVTRDYGALGWLIANFVETFQMTAREVMLPGCSMSHVGGYCQPLMAFAAAARVVVPRSLDGAELLPLFRDERPTAMFMLPSALFALVRDHGASHEDFVSLRCCISGGDKVSATLDQEFTAMTGLRLAEGYGMTETGITSVNMPPDAIKLGSVGKLAPGNAVSIRDAEGQELPVGKMGRLWVKFPGNATGYWMNPEATAETMVDGWLDSGDVMRLDEDGFLWFGGRLKQIIVHDGSNICPQEVEEALIAHPAVASAGVVGVHDLLHGENLRAYVTLKEGFSRPSDQDLIGFTRNRVGYKAPEEIVVLAEMPFTPTGKVDRASLKRLAASC